MAGIGAGWTTDPGDLDHRSKGRSWQRSGLDQRLYCQHANSIWSPPLPRHRRLAATVLLVSLLTGCGTWQPVSEQGRERCARESRSGAGSNALTSAMAYGQCLLGVDTRLAREQERSLRQQRALQERRLGLCRRHKAALPGLVTSFRQRRDQLLALEAEVYVASQGPKPLDPQEQRRLAIYDQEIEQELYDQQLEAWRLKEQGRAAAWKRRHQAQLNGAEAALRASADRLRVIDPDLLEASARPALREASLKQWLACRPETFQ